MESIICFGAGINSTAMTLLLYEQGNHLPIVFADTGCEWPETYAFINLFEKYLLKQWNIKIIKVQSERGNMYDWFWKEKKIPFVRARMCTRIWKLEPIVRNFPTAKVHFVGIGADESHRAKREFKRYKVVRKFPLIETGIKREDCKKIIERHGLPVPPRSNCFICPFQSLERYRELASRHPDLFAKAVALEERAGRWLKYYAPLRKLILLDKYTR